ncbi:MAG: BON domain-containing protein [Chitinivibrionales bacterium]|nr:BON domain-containing protein [Chitinivibrionales bacterium]MBD3396504.1 BON domain-containing protein [Chitinivibrionales bacterium]
MPPGAYVFVDFAKSFCRFDNLPASDMAAEGLVCRRAGTIVAVFHTTGQQKTAGLFSGAGSAGKEEYMSKWKTRMMAAFHAGAGTIVALMAVAWFSTAAAALESGFDDKDITYAIERDLSHEGVVSAHLVDIATNEGVVTLSGSVSNLLEKERTVEIVRSIRGVRSIVDRIDVRPVERSDSEIRKDVTFAFVLDPVADSYEVDVAVDDGIVVLSGSVESWAEKNICTNVAKSVKGVRGVDNEIEVVYEGERSDAEIKTDVERRLQLDPYVQDELLEVQVNDGVVKLKGTVGSLSEKAFARTNALVLGAEEVDLDDVSIKFWALDPAKRGAKVIIKSDDALEKAVQDALSFDPRVRVFDIDVGADAGVITLEGEVDNLRAVRAAVEDARRVVGVARVKNFLKVRMAEYPSDREIEENAEYILNWDPVIERYEIDVDVRNGMVYLYGIVDTRYEKEHAADCVSSAPGVVAVVNNLSVGSLAWRWKSDKEIRRSIENELRWSAYVDDENISVKVDDGTAILTGSADTKHEYRAAVENAFDGGAKIVQARLKLNGRKDIETYYYRDTDRYDWWN